MAAQNQHYVPQFILRQFLSNEEKEQVSVYDKKTEKTFTTSIRNIMAERRFNDFSFGDWMVSFEPVACKIEDMVLPFYQRIIETRRLERTPEEQAALGFLMAFQIVRTKGYRDRLEDIEGIVRRKVESLGGRMEDIEGWEPLTEDVKKREHLRGIKNGINSFAEIIAQKDFLLMEPAPGRSFYLGDNPVCLHNMLDFGPYGNLGIGVTGIEIYLPLASDLLLCAWCPSLLQGTKALAEQAKIQSEREALSALLDGAINGRQMKNILDAARLDRKPTLTLLENFEAGVPTGSFDINMEYYNSLQAGAASRYLICQKSDFDLAKRHNLEFPDLRSGRRLGVA